MQNFSARSFRMDPRRTGPRQHGGSCIAPVTRHPKVGASREGFVLEQLVTHLSINDEHIYYWATHGGAELDVFIPRGQKRIGFAIKRTTTPRLTPSIKAALDDLDLRETVVIHARDQSFPLGKK